MSKQRKYRRFTSELEYTPRAAIAQELTICGSYIRQLISGELVTAHSRPVLLQCARKALFYARFYREEYPYRIQLPGSAN